MWHFGWPPSPCDIWWHCSAPPPLECHVLFEWPLRWLWQKGSKMTSHDEQLTKSAWCFPFLAKIRLVNTVLLRFKNTGGARRAQTFSNPPTFAFHFQPFLISSEFSSYFFLLNFSFNSFQFRTHELNVVCTFMFKTLRQLKVEATPPPKKWNVCVEMHGFWLLNA